MAKDIRKQIKIDEEDKKLLAKLLKTRRYGSNESEVFRRGLKCLEDEETQRAPKK